jgi:hypothetical protein
VVEVEAAALACEAADVVLINVVRLRADCTILLKLSNRLAA